MAIVCHEVVHHYLREKDIQRPDTAATERLTDVAAIYLGMGYHLKLGYLPSETETRQLNAEGQSVTRQFSIPLGTSLMKRSLA